MNETKIADTMFLVRRTYAASREDCFDAWTNPEKLKRWYAPVDGWTVSVAEVDLRVGGGFHLEFGPPGGAPVVEYATYLEVSPPERLVYTLDLKASHAKEDTRVLVEFLAVEGGTEVRVTEEGYSSKEIRDMHLAGLGHMLDLLGGVVTTV